MEDCGEFVGARVEPIGIELGLCEGTTYPITVPILLLAILAPLVVIISIEVWDFLRR